MKKNQIQGIINDFIDYRGYENPIHHFWLKEKLEINLISGKINYLEEDSFTEFYKHKRKWFMGRVKKLKGKLADFQEAKVIVFGAKEKIFIEYKDKTFEKERIYEDFGREIKKLKDAIKKLKPINISKNKI